MLSDVLRNTIKDIKQYQRDYPYWYDDIKQWVDAVTGEIDILRKYLETEWFRENAVEKATRQAKKQQRKA